MKLQKRRDGCKIFTDCVLTLPFVSASYWADLRKATLRDCQTPAGPGSSPFQSDILGSPRLALLTETVRIQGQLLSPSSESAQWDAAAANANTKLRNSYNAWDISSRRLNYRYLKTKCFLPAGGNRGSGLYPTVLGADCWSGQWHPESGLSRSSLGS